MNDNANNRQGYDTIKNLYDVNNINRPGYDTVANLYGVKKEESNAVQNSEKEIKNEESNQRPGYDTIKNLYDVNNVNRPGYDTVANLYGVKKEESSAVQNPEKEIKNEGSNQRPGYDTIKNLYDVNNVNRPGYDTVANLYGVDQRKIFADIDKKMKKEYENILMTEDLSNTSQTFDAIAAGLGVDKNTLIEYVKYKKEQAKKKANLNKDVSIGKDDKSKVESADINSLINKLREINKLIEIDWNKNFTLEINRERKQIIEQLKKLNVTIPSIEGSKNNDKEEKISEKSKEETTKKYPELSPEDAEIIFDIYSQNKENNATLNDLAAKYKVDKAVFYDMYNSNKHIKNDDSNTVIDGKFINSLEKNVLKARPSGKPTAGSPKGGLKGATLGKKRVTLIKNETNFLKTLPNPIEKETFKERVLNHIKAWGASFKNRVFPAFNTTEFTNDEDNKAIDKLASGVSEEDLINKANVR